MSPLKITVVVDNRVNKKGFLAEHGLSLLIEYKGQRFLFDTGQGLVLHHNLNHLQVHPSTLKGLILSHGHYDHTGGLKILIERTEKLQVYAHPGVFQDKVGKDYHSIGIPYSQQELEDKGVTFQLEEGPYGIREDMILTGAIPRRYDWEDTGGEFYLKGTEHYCEDPLTDDESLIIKTPKGVVVLIGCCHSGLINTLDYVTKLMGVQEIYGVIGGMHLLRSSEDRIEKTLKALSTFNVKRLVPLHCTGFYASLAMAKQFPTSFQEGGVGMVWNDF